ncbi:MAG: molybdopterin-dependent oxidoreductase, partial [Anaerolineae bacterium]|nr:molybdopterin-dependent oxidoreductase [Anaerolineae bacterium]
MSITRRTFLKLGLSGSGALILGIAPTARGLQGEPLAQLALNPWVEIGADNRITLIIDKSEMGQGVETALAQILAEELAIEWS